MGRGCYHLFHLSFGISFIKGIHRFLPRASGHLIPLGEVELQYGEPTFIVQTMKSGRACHREFLPETTLIFEEGRDLFAFSQKRRVIALLDGTTDSEMVALSVQLSVLQAMLGEPEAMALLGALGLQNPPSVTVREVPKFLSSLLHSAMSKTLRGTIQKLYAQAKALEYLSILSEHFRNGPVSSEPRPQSRKQIEALHAHLLSLEGKVPTIEVLAMEFGVPGRRLNDDFTKEYGMSIFAFITGHRLDQARAAMLQEEIPMKDLAARLGYSHVNNFISAFRKRFGQSPGSLRRGAKKD
jgi:AraC-like DNA-binding protein